MFDAPQPSSLTAQVSPLPGGLVGIRQTLRVMRALVNQYKVDPWLRQCAANVIFLQPEKDGFHEVQSLFEYVRDKIRYVRDIANVETIQTPAKTLEIQYGDCDDQTTLLATLLESVGYPTQFVVAGYEVPGAFEHVYLQTRVDDYVIPMDPTERENFGFEPPGAVALYYEGE